jgi:hypothetical protein
MILAGVGGIPPTLGEIVNGVAEIMNKMLMMR